jgi:hypothetical protein
VLFVGAGAVLLFKPDRRQAVGRFLLPIGELVFDQVVRAQEGIRHLDQHAVAVKPSNTIEARIAEVLVIRGKSGPLLAREIQDELRNCDPGLIDVPSVDELRAALVAAPCFEERPKWRYSLGHRYQ